MFVLLFFTPADDTSRTVNESTVVRCRCQSIARPVDAAVTDSNQRAVRQMGLFQGLFHDGVEQSVNGVQVPHAEVHPDVTRVVCRRVSMKSFKRLVMIAIVVVTRRARTVRQVRVDHVSQKGQGIEHVLVVNVELKLPDRHNNCLHKTAVINQV